MSFRRLWLVARQDLAYNARRPLFWFLVALLALTAWGLTGGWLRVQTGDSAVGGKTAWLTSEFALARMLPALIFLFYIFFLAVAAGMSVIRDDESKVGEILHATPLRVSEYVWGKYAAVLLSFLVVLGVHLTITILLNHAVPNAEMLKTRGPFHLVNYLRPALVFGLPVIVFFSGSAFYIGERTRKPILVFILPIALLGVCGFFLWSFSPSWLSPTWNYVMQLVDPAGQRWMDETWLKVDRGVDFYNTQPVDYFRGSLHIGFDAGFVLSRLAFALLGLACVALAQRHLERSLRRSVAGRKARREMQRAAAAVLEGEWSVLNPAAVTGRPLAELGMRATAPSWWEAMRETARAEVRELRTQPGLYLFLPIILLQTLGATLQATGAFDTPMLWTSGTLAASQMSYLVTMMTLLVMFYAVEGAERERSTSFAAIHSTLPVRTSAWLTGKVIAVSVVSVAAIVACFLGDAVAMLIQGKVALRLWPFLLVWGLLLMPTFVVWTSFVLAVFSLTKNRYTAYALSIAALAATFYRALTGKLSWLGNWGLWGAVDWSDMSVLEIDRRALLLNRLFALALAVLFARIAIRYFPRREPDPIGTMSRLRPGPLWRAFRSASPLILLPLAIGGAVWREVDRGPTGNAVKRATRDYWKKNLATWRDAPVPSLAHVDLDVGLEPARRAWTVKGEYTVVNSEEQPLRQVPLTVGFDWHDMKWTMNGKPYLPDTASHLYVFTPPRPLAPGDTLRLGFSYRGAQAGATKDGDGASEFILPSGVVMTGFTPRWFPTVGYVEEIGVEEDRNGYEPRQYPDDFYRGRTAPLFGAGVPMTTHIRITAPKDFTANANGVKVSDSVSGATRTVVWQCEHPMMQFNIVAGRYTEWRGQGTALYYHPEHAYNIKEMGVALDAARKYYGEWFGAYPWGVLKISEFPAMARYAQGFPTNISFSEGIGFLTKSTPETNVAFMVVAHESAHQWWGNIVQPGKGPGGNLLSEGMAHFSTALLTEQVLGVREAMEFRKLIENRYANARQADAERPLVRVDGSHDGDNTVTYDKGGWVFWMLMGRMGRDRSLAAHRAFVAAYHGNPDHPVLQDYVDWMRSFAPDTASFNDYVRQWFFDVVLPEYQVPAAKTTKLADGTWETRATVTNVGTGRMPVDVAVTSGERWPAKGKAKPASAAPYRSQLTTITLGAKGSQEVVIRSSFKPEKVIVDPDVKVLQLRRKTAETKL